MCVYCDIGQRATAVARIIETLRRHNSLAHTITIFASDDDPPDLRFVTPYATTTMAEYFTEQGRGVDNLAAMQSAERNLDERLDEVTMTFRRARQNAITSELLDVVSGFEALTAERDAGH